MTPEESMPSMIKKPPESNTIWVLAFDPPDCPNGWTLRPQFVCQIPNEPGVIDLSPYGQVVQSFVGKKITCLIASPLVWRNKRRDELESILPPSCVPLGPQPGDAPYVVQVWIE